MSSFMAWLVCCSRQPKSTFTSSKAFKQGENEVNVTAYGTFELVLRKSPPVTLSGSMGPKGQNIPAVTS